jgi:hypothetical protein
MSSRDNELMQTLAQLTREDNQVMIFTLQGIRILLRC